MADPKQVELVARVGFNAPNLDGEGELRFAAGDVVPEKALTDVMRGDLTKQGVIAKSNAKNPPELGWAQGHTVVDGVVVDPAAEEVSA